MSTCAATHGIVRPAWGLQQRPPAGGSSASISRPAGASLVGRRRQLPSCRWLQLEHSPTRGSNLPSAAARDAYDDRLGAAAPAGSNGSWSAGAAASSTPRDVQLSALLDQLRAALSDEDLATALAILGTIAKDYSVGVASSVTVNTLDSSKNDELLHLQLQQLLLTVALQTALDAATRDAARAGALETAMATIAERNLADAKAAAAAAEARAVEAEAAAAAAEARAAEAEAAPAANRDQWKREKAEAEAASAADKDEWEREKAVFLKLIRKQKAEIEELMAQQASAALQPEEASDEEQPPLA